MEHISSISNNISASKVTSLNKLPARFIKDSSPVISKPRTHIVNLSVSTRHIRNDLKVAKIVPLYKKKSKSNIDNYIPVAVLSIISKVFEYK